MTNKGAPDRDHRRQKHDHRQLDRPIGLVGGKQTQQADGQCGAEEGGGRRNPKRRREDHRAGVDGDDEQCGPAGADRRRLLADLEQAPAASEPPDRLRVSAQVKLVARLDAVRLERPLEPSRPRPGRDEFDLPLASGVDRAIALADQRRAVHHRDVGGYPPRRVMGGEVREQPRLRRHLPGMVAAHHQHPVVVMDHRVGIELRPFAVAQDGEKHRAGVAKLAAHRRNPHPPLEGPDRHRQLEYLDGAAGCAFHASAAWSEAQPKIIR
jgi:hypothetical protein